MHKALQLILAVTVENKNQFILPMFGTVSVVEKNYELLQPKKRFLMKIICGTFSFLKCMSSTFS